MRRINSWRAHKRKGAVRNRIKQEYQNFINAIHEDDVVIPNSSNCKSRKDDKDLAGSTTKKAAISCNEIPAKEINATSYTGQEQGSDMEQEGSAQFFCEDDIYKEFIDIMSNSSSDEEEQESDLLTKNIELREKLKDWALRNNISQSSLKELLLILNESFGSTISLPMDPRTILQTPLEVNIKNIKGGEYWHHGIIQQLTKLLNNWVSLPSTIHLMFNFDGLPIFKSAKKEFWPILAKVVEGDNDLFIIGIYYGTGKPKKIEEYLSDFVTEMKMLLDIGICINDRKICVKIKCFVCDSPARAFIKGIISSKT